MINLPKFFKDNDPESPELLFPLLPLRDIVVFPHMVAPLFVGRSKSVKALSDAMNNDKRVFLATQKKAGIDNPTEKDISHIGTIAKILQLLRLPDGTVKALIEGNQKLYSKATRNEYQLGSTSNIVRLKQSLEKREIIGTGSMDIIFIDPIFREWLRRRYFSR